MSKPIVFDDHIYINESACTAECLYRISNYKAGGALSADDTLFFRQVLAAHPDYSDKIGCGIESIKYGYHADFGDDCLYMVRHDGSEECTKWGKAKPSCTAPTFIKAGVALKGEKLSWNKEQYLAAKMRQGVSNTEAERRRDKLVLI